MAKKKIEVDNDLVLKAVLLGILIGMLITPPIQWAGAAVGAWLAKVI